VVTRDIPSYAIAAGVPAKVIGNRFENDEIAAHELGIARGNFIFSERGHHYWTVEPYRKVGDDGFGKG
jgi:hypothetical protein